MSRKKLAIVVRWPTGGIRTYLKYLFSHLPVEVYQPIIIGPDVPEARCLLDNLRDFEPINRLTRNSSIAIAKMAYKVITKDKVDLIHSHGFTSAAVATIPAMLTRTPHLISAHDLVTEGLRKKLGKLGFFTLQTSLKLATAIHAISNTTAANLRAVLPPRAADNIQTIRSGINVEQFSGDIEPRDLRSELEIPSDAFIIGFLGRFMGPKGFGTLVDAVDFLNKQPQRPPRPFTIIAVNTGGFFREEIEAIKTRGLTHNFRFLPFTENPAATMKAMDCLAIPSNYEAFGLLAVEAMCMGIPVVMSNCDGLMEVAAKSPARFFNVGDAKSLGEALVAEMKSSSLESAKNYAPIARAQFDAANHAMLMRLLWSRLMHRLPLD